VNFIDDEYFVAVARRGHTCAVSKLPGCHRPLLDAPSISSTSMD
jgi:hypothetical protein